MKTIIQLLLLYTLLTLFPQAQAQSTAQQYLPSSAGEIITHSYYTLAYSEEHEQALWVYYILDHKMISGPAVRKNNFTPDKKVSTGSANKEDYINSGYDKGHLCPAASMTINQRAIDESFYMSNISPQHPKLNRHTWADLEKYVRGFVITERIIHVITGPIFSEISSSIGDNQVSIPGHFYKIIYSPAGGKMLAFILPNKKAEASLSNYIVTVDAVEVATGIDFFPEFPDTIEQQLESESNQSLWIFKKHCRKASRQ